MKVNGAADDDTTKRNGSSTAPIDPHMPRIVYCTILTSLNCAIATRKSRNESLGDAGAPTVYCNPM